MKQPMDDSFRGDLPLRHKLDYAKYDAYLRDTVDENGDSHADQAMAALHAELSQDKERLDEFAWARVKQVAKTFDDRRQPDIIQGRLAVTEDNWLVCGENIRRSVNTAKYKSVRIWLDVRHEEYAKSAYRIGVIDRDTRQLLEIMEKRDCTMWEASKAMNE